VDDVSLSTLATEKETAISAAKKNCHISSQKMPRRMPHQQPKNAMSAAKKCHIRYHVSCHVALFVTFIFVIDIELGLG